MSNVLLIEPNAVLARTYAQALEHAGHTVAQAFTAQEGIHAADEHTPDVVVLELQLSSHNGVEFLHEFRSYAEWQHIPVVVHTVIVPHVIEPTLAPLQDLGVRACLYKPRTTLGQLLSAVNQQVVTA